MPAPSVVRSSTNLWGGSYPLNFSGTFNATGADLLLIFMTSIGGYSYTPDCAFAGQAATLVASGNDSSNTSAGQIWVWAVQSPSQTTGTLTILKGDQYANSGCVYIVALSGVAASPIGASNAKIVVATTATANITTVGANSLILGLVQGGQTSGVTASGLPSPTQLLNNTTGSNNVGQLYSQGGYSSGAAVSLTATVPYNYPGATLVEVLGSASGPTITTGSLTLSLGLGVGSVVIPPRITAGSLNLSLGLGSGSIAMPGLITSPPLSLSLGLNSGTVSVAGVPPHITAGPLNLALAQGTGSLSVLPAPITLPTVLAPGDSVTLTLRFSPTASGSRNGSLTLVSNDSRSPQLVLLSGTATPSGPQRIGISGNQFVLPDGNYIRLRSVNFSGAEGENYAPHALWTRAWKSELDQIKSWGFNSIRLPFSGTFCQNPAIPSTAINATLNADVVGKTSLQFLDMIVDYCGQIGLYIVLDHHRCSQGAGTDGWPGAGGSVGSYSEAQWHSDWLVLANRYKTNPVVVGADVHNEPYALAWSDWAPMVERCAEAIHAVAPDWLIFVEGGGQFTGSAIYPTSTSFTNDGYWWGGQLIGAQLRPISLTHANRVVYSPHEYGQSVSSQSWLAPSGAAISAGYPMNLYAVWKLHWGWVYEQNIAPIWIGEMGGKFGYANGTGTLSLDSTATYERQWLAELCKYLNGDFNGDGASDITGSKKGMSFAYWNYMLSGDTGGLVIDNDLSTPQTGKLTLLNSILTT